ncbi:MAG: hypothetical protein ACRC3H_08190 [Lachnospiraceae bacterium]
MTEAEKTSILEWMDKQIELNEELRATKNFSEDIRLVQIGYDDEIHVSEGLRRLAEATGTDVMWQDKTTFQNPQFNVIYKGYKFFELGPTLS